MIDIKKYIELHEQLEEKIAQIAEAYTQIYTGYRTYDYEDFYISSDTEICVNLYTPYCGGDTNIFHILIEDINNPISVFEDYWEEKERKRLEKNELEEKEEKEKHKIRLEADDKRNYKRLKKKYEKK